MFSDEMQRTVMAAPRNDLPRLSGMLWKAYAGGAIGEGQAQGLSELIEARKAAPAPARAATARRCGSRPRSSESMDRRRQWCASGRLPPQLAAKFSLAEVAVLAVVGVEVVKAGDCRLAIGHIAALAGVSASTVRNALREARRLELLTIEERRLTAFRSDTNIIRIISPEWRTWLRLGRDHRGGYKSVKPTHTDSSLSAPPVASPRFKGPFDKLWAENSGHLGRLPPKPKGR